MFVQKRGPSFCACHCKPHSFVLPHDIHSLYKQAFQTVVACFLPFPITSCFATRSLLPNPYILSHLIIPLFRSRLVQWYPPTPISLRLPHVSGAGPAIPSFVFSSIEYVGILIQTIHHSVRLAPHPAFTKLSPGLYHRTSRKRTTVPPHNGGYHGILYSTGGD